MSKTPEQMAVLIQEAFYRGWVEGFKHCHQPCRSKTSSDMIAAYKLHKSGIMACYRERFKRTKTRGNR